MALRDPFAAYNAKTNFEAQQVCELLLAEGIEAFVIEDVSNVGAWVGGFISEIHKPQDRTRSPDLDRV